MPNKEKDFFEEAIETLKILIAALFGRKKDFSTVSNTNVVTNFYISVTPIFSARSQLAAPP